MANHDSNDHGKIVIMHDPFMYWITDGLWSLANIKMINEQFITVQNNDLISQNIKHH